MIHSLVLQEEKKLIITTDEFFIGKIRVLENDTLYKYISLEADTTISVGPFNFPATIYIERTTGSYTYTEVDRSTNTRDFEFIGALNDLPDPVNGVITLESDRAYFITSHIDLKGNRLVGGNNTAILGTSSETCSITSTGLEAGVALFTTSGTTPIQNITFMDVDTAFDIDGDGSNAYDWKGFNIVNVPNIGTFGTMSNFLLTESALVNSNNMLFTGTVGTVGANGCLFSGDGEAGAMMSLEATAVITRRFRLIYSAVIATADTVAFNVDESATVPTEGYILDTINFAGGGTYLSGVGYATNTARFINCIGIQNTAEIALMYMRENATATTIGTTNTPVKIAGTTTASAVNQKFSHSANRLTYTGALDRVFKVEGTVSVSSGNNQVIGLYIAVNGEVDDNSEMYVTTSGNGDFQNITIQTFVELSTNDYVEIWIENNTATTNVTADFLSCMISSASN